MTAANTSSPSSWCSRRAANVRYSVHNQAMEICLLVSDELAVLYTLFSATPAPDLGVRSQKHCPQGNMISEERRLCLHMRKERDCVLSNCCEPEAPILVANYRSTSIDQLRTAPGSGCRRRIDWLSSTCPKTVPHKLVELSSAPGPTTLCALA